MTSRHYFPDLDEIRESDRFVIFKGSQIVVKGDDFMWDCEQLDLQLLHNSQLLLIEEEPSGFIAVQANPSLIEQLDAECRSLRSLLFTQRDYDVSVAGKASQIIDWYGTHRFCGSCGNPTRHHET
ncbi:uncharacterized protein METZ01_LOCUS454824, partial [marine metagenome]